MTPPQSDQARRQAETANKLVNLSTILGWGGLGMLFAVTPSVGIVTHSGAAALVLAGIGVISAIAGGIVGQIGRGMQGRVI